jgi:hypothetical protein
MVALRASQATGRAPPTVVDAGAPPPGRDKEMMAALGAAQETGMAPPIVVDAGAPPG